MYMIAFAVLALGCFIAGIKTAHSVQLVTQMVFVVIGFIVNSFAIRRSSGKIDMLRIASVLLYIFIGGMVVGDIVYLLFS